MISKEFIEENKEKLLSEKERLEKLLSKIAKPNPEVKGDYKATYPDFGTDSDENATEFQEYEANIAEEQQLEKKLLQVNSALQRIEDGIYGKDVSTGREISEDRLRVVPEAETDISHHEE